MDSKIIIEGLEYFKSKLCNTYFRGIDCIDEAIKGISELSQYKTLEEQELYRKFPCKVGDTVQVLIKGCSDYRIDDYVVKYIHMDENGITIGASEKIDGPGVSIDHSPEDIERDISEFGKTIFLSYEQAAVARDKLREEHCKE